MGHCSRCLGELPESRIHSWCRQCLRDYKEQRRDSNSSSSTMDTDKTTDDEKWGKDVLGEDLDQRTGRDLYDAKFAPPG